MDAGENSPVVEAIRTAESLLGTQIRVHLNRRHWDTSPLLSAWQIFSSNRPPTTPPQTGILFYFNLRCRAFAVVSDEDWKSLLAKVDWSTERRILHKELSETHIDHALARMIKRVTAQLKHAPQNKNESFF